MAQAKQVTDIDQQYLTFVLDGESYGIDVLQVQEIRAWESTRPIPEAPDYIKGLLDLRGEMVPIVDLRARFSLERVDYTPTTVIIVISVQVGEHNEVVGIVVDNVSDVVNVKQSGVRPAPKLGQQINTEFIHGMIRNDDAMVMLLETGRLFDPQALATLGQLST